MEQPIIYIVLVFLILENGTAVGENGTILRTTDGGTNWTQQISGTTDWLGSVSFIDSDNGTAVGGELLLPSYGIILRTTNGGTNWTQQISEEPLYSVSFTDSDNGIAVGGNELFTNGSTILRTSNGGSTWNSQISPSFLPLIGVSFTGKEKVTAVGFGGTIEDNKWWRYICRRRGDR